MKLSEMKAIVEGSSSTQRDRLMAILKEPYAADPEYQHKIADNAIIAFIDSFDPELAQAIDDARDVQDWWYS